MTRAQLTERMRDELRVDRGSDIPIGTQLAWALERLVGSGALAPGDRLPSVRQLAEAAGVNVNTVRSVYARLEERGLLASEHGRGTFVRGAGEEQGSRRPDRQYRRELMRQIAELERQIAYYTRHRPVGSLEPPRRGRPASQLLPAGELMTIRDELQARVAELRRTEEERLTRVIEERAAVAAEQAEERAEEVRLPRRNRGTAPDPPRIVLSPGAWALKWRG